MDHTQEHALSPDTEYFKEVIKYVDLRYDVAFKSVFGKPGNEDLLLILLNAILPDLHLVSVRLNEQEQTPDRADAQRAITDIHCTTGDGRQFLVEMQVAKQKDFADRMIYYASFPVRNYAGRGARTIEELKLHYKLPMIYVIGILDFVMTDVTPNDNIINDYSLMNRENGVQLSNSVHFVTVELPKFKKTEAELRTDIDCLLYLFMHLGTMKKIPETLRHRNLDKLFEEAKFVAMKMTEQEKYLRQLMWEWDQEGALATARITGLEEGREEGREQGRAEGKAEGLAEGVEATKRENARNLKHLGVAAEIICQATGLTLQEVEQL